MMKTLNTHKIVAGRHKERHKSEDTLETLPELRSSDVPEGQRKSNCAQFGIECIYCKLSLSPYIYIYVPMYPGVDSASKNE
jgi:hypothetical protein